MEGQFTISTIIIIVWLIFPGVIFKRFYFKGQFAKQFGVGLFADRLITSIFWGIVVQIITFLIYSRSFGFTFTSIKSKAEELYGKIADNKMPDLTYDRLTYILGYLAFLILVAFLLGTVFHHLIRLFKIDLKFPVFRFSNHWNYYFRGEIVAMSEFRSLDKGKWLSTMVDIVIDDGTDNNKMISGFLTQHTISQKTGDLEALYLTGAKRYSKTSQAFKDIPGDCLVIPFDKVIDLNLRYTFQALTPLQRKELIFKKAVRFTLSIGFIIILIVPWTFSTEIFNTLLGIIFGITSWILSVIVVSNPFHPNINNRLSLKDQIATVIFILFTVAIMLYFWSLLPIKP
ncbi:hypothetical protein D0C36_14465 [Mucilaginibacter conchicola]|uniref:Uncharacterized protein n=1 Tax=Mucilaginibacter conchicola TaxID=2303333 RepID=A0A372NTP4_9SPHI|nr:hypothetical protein [Mucilaginibacter conchicola]RFZ92616.1 hypothetical protein D0C36_14465 [Mucilaginibacter conchicola]